MAGNGEESDPTTLPAEEAFARLGDETRLEILQTLGDADEPLSFSDLRDRVGYEIAGNFSYQLDKLTGHSVRKADGRYARTAAQSTTSSLPGMMGANAGGHASSDSIECDTLE